MRATPAVSYGRVVEALDAARGAGAERPGLVTTGVEEAAARGPVAPR